MEKEEKILEFINKRPGIECAYGYGSGVFKQVGYENANPQIDLILTVPNIYKYHIKNMDINPQDYSKLGRYFYLNSGSNEKIKGKNQITYQSHIEENGMTFKYGIIETEDLKSQLKTWNRFYLPGRFQKPILKIKSNEEVDKLIDFNREAAFKVALLLLENKDSISKEELYATIVSLSYMGDTRMKFFENPNKVKNIVNGDIEFFKNCYNYSDYFNIIDDKIRVYYQLLLKNVSELPEQLYKYLLSIKDNITYKEAITNFLIEHNKEESISQTIHGLKTNGVVKSSIYVLQKAKKRLNK